MSENEQNFEQLGKLLKLKQHEVPPPGYFNRFSGQVIARIRAGEAAKPQNFAERMQENSSWLANLLRIFDAKPGMIGGFATSMCLLLLLTVVFAERSEQAPKTSLQRSDPNRQRPAWPALQALPRCWRRPMCRAVLPSAPIP